MTSIPAPKAGISLHNLLPYLLLLAVITAVNAVGNCFSPLNSLYGCPDPACFYTAGKAWAHGLLPYRDFADVKGPLLFFLYRMGYMLSPDKTYGVFAIHVLAGAVTSFLIYRTCLLYAKSTAGALLSALCTIGIIYWKGSAGGTAESELLIIPAFAWLIYNFCATLNGRGSLRALAWSIGFGAAYTLLIKFNTTLPFAATFGLSLAIIYRHRLPLSAYFSFTAHCCGAFLLLLAPFAVYLFANGIAQDCADVYIFANIGTYAASNGSSFYLGGGGLKNLFRILIGQESVPIKLTLVYLIGTLMLKGKGERTHALLLLLFVLAAYLCCCPAPFPYYYIFCAPLLLLPFTALTNSIQSLQHKGISVLWVAAVSIAVICLSRGNSIISPYAVEELEAKMAAKENPTMLYWDQMDLGVGSRSGALPAVPLWTCMNGTESALYKETEAAIAQGTCDFVFTAYPVSAERRAFLEHSGYSQAVEQAVDFVEPRGVHMTLMMWEKKR